MNWVKLAEHDWREPLALVQDAAAEKECALLYSGRQETHSGRYSYAFFEPAFQATGSRWTDLPSLTAEVSDLPDWVGYLGYGMRCDSDGGFIRQAAAPITLPDFWLTRYQRLFRFDHTTQQLEQFGRYHATNSLVPNPRKTSGAPSVEELASNMSRAQYTHIVQSTIAAIEAGDFYQANITRKFHGRFTSAPDSASLFAALSAASPAPYSAYIRHGDLAILSSSPEGFLKLDAQGQITSRPIKGSIRRGQNENEDAALKKALSSNGKNLAENLMIVDLMRHDLAQVSQVGSVAVAEQSALYSYATIHHLVSTVQAAKRADADAYQVVRACFPPGSMTGAPKRAAMQWCDRQEAMERGIYSGAIGWFGGGDTVDLSVVIRTLIIEGDRFEFQVGGGIVADSDPDDEWRETLIKARGIAAALGISEQALEAL